MKTIFLIASLAALVWLCDRIITPQAHKPIIINVKDYGAYGDGIHDDTQAIQRALDATSKNGESTIFYPNGTYLSDWQWYPHLNFYKGAMWHSIEREDGKRNIISWQIFNELTWPIPRYYYKEKSTSYYELWIRVDNVNLINL